MQPDVSNTSRLLPQPADSDRMGRGAQAASNPSAPLLIYPGDSTYERFRSFGFDREQAEALRDAGYRFVGLPVSALEAK